MKNNSRKGPGVPAEKPKDFKKSLERLFKELGGFKKLIFVSLILAALSSILSIFSPNMLSSLTDEIQKGIIVDNKTLKKVTTKTIENMSSDSTKNNITLIFQNNNISNDDKEKFRGIISNKEEMVNKIDEIPESIKEIMLDDISIKNTKISSKDQFSLLEVINSKSYSSLNKLPKSIKKLIEPEMNMKRIKTITISLALIYLLSAMFNYIQSIIMATVSNNFARKLRMNISKKINNLPLKYFDKNQNGDILSRITNDVDTMAQSMNQSFSTLVSALTLFIGTIIMMFYTNCIMAITAIVSNFIGFIFMFIILSKSQKYFKSRQEELGNLNSHIEEIYSGLNVVKTSNAKELSDKKFDEYNYKVFESNRKSQFLSGLMMPFMGFIGNFGYVCVCIVGAILTMKNMITFGTIVAFITYVRLFTSPLSQIGQAMTSLQSTSASSERVFEFLDEKEMSDEKDISKKLNPKEVKGNIEFDNVYFKYDGNDDYTIKNFSAKIKPSQKIAIVGPTGAGKTTIVNLLMKFYDIDKGDIKIDGVSINDLSRENIHDLFTMVLQDTWLFDGSVEENIIYNRKNMPLDKVREVCKIVGIDHFIRTLPKGYDSKIMDNDSVSAGQRQLITIARAMLEETPFLILDEATSNVDTRTEELVQNAMDKLTKGKTSFIIAHRLSTIKNADLILVLKDGNIIEQGNHNELMKQNGFYADLYNSQFEL